MLGCEEKVNLSLSNCCFLDSPSVHFEGEWFAYSAGGNFTPHIVTVAAGEDVATRILSFSHKGPRSICILSANGSVSNVTLRQPGSSGGTLTYEGRFEIISLSGSFTITENGGMRSRTGGISVSLAGPDGRVVGGGVSGMLLAASPIQVVVGSFLPNVLKQQKQRTILHSPPLSTVPIPSGVLTAARPRSQANPDEQCNIPRSTLYGHNAHEEAQNNQGNNSTIANCSSSSSPIQPISWHGLQPSADWKPSPDINVCLTSE
ncbi:hypothetical protein Taro_045810 [Colocasia esculenta]|uniref:AT-hook motif nuclear-localized protein n=1 Tax=Colocasia esculenta TaxID=4460 RepID=A0A843X6V0_COLES|nr:hypothetical protein [Colocasia esculenta]